MTFPYLLSEWALYNHFSAQSAELRTPRIYVWSLTYLPPRITGAWDFFPSFKKFKFLDQHTTTSELNWHLATATRIFFLPIHIKI